MFLLNFSRHSGRASPVILLNIPDGHQKEMPTSGSKHKDQPGAKEVRLINCVTATPGMASASIALR